MSLSGIHVPRMPGCASSTWSGSGFTVSSLVKFTLDHGIPHTHRQRSLHAWSSSRSRAWNLFSPPFLSLPSSRTWRRDARGSCEIIVDPGRGGDCALKPETRLPRFFASSKNFLRNFNPKVIGHFAVNFLVNRE